MMASRTWPSPPRISLFLGILALAILASVFIMQYGLGHEPCHLCLLERWPWAAVAVVALAGLACGRPRLGLALAAMALLVGVGLSLYHVGVETRLIDLPQSCVAGTGARTTSELRVQLLSARPTCDQVTVAYFGLSLATWNAVASVLAFIVSLAGLFSLDPKRRTPLERQERRRAGAPLF